MATALSCASDGKNRESPILTGSVSVLGAVAPTSMPSSRPTPEMVTATAGLDSLLHESLRITVLMTRSIGPPGPACRLDPVGIGRVRMELRHLGRTSIGALAQQPAMRENAGPSGSTPGCPQ